MKVVEKAFAYITLAAMQKEQNEQDALQALQALKETRLLVFRHADFPEAGVQVPAGTIAPGETAAAAVLREAEEETGLGSFLVPRFLGLQEFDARPFGKEEIHQRHFFHLQARGPVQESWRHYERDPSDGSGRAIAFDLYWLPLQEAGATLVASHGALLPLLTGRPA